MQWLFRTCLRLFALLCVLVVFGCPKPEPERQLMKYGPPPIIEEPVVDSETVGQETTAEPAPAEEVDPGE